MWTQEGGEGLLIKSARKHLLMMDNIILNMTKRIYVGKHAVLQKLIDTVVEMVLNMFGSFFF